MKRFFNRISVVIPTYNRRDCLARLLGQLQDQVVKSVKMSIIVVVDGSTDGTCDMLLSKFPGIDFVMGDGHWWWTKSINEGCKYALERGADAVLLMNDDTEVDPGYVESLLKHAELHPDAVIGSLNITRMKPHQIYFSGVKKITWWKAKYARYHKMFALYDENLKGLHQSLVLMGRGMFIPSTVFKKIGFFDDESFPQYKADLDFVLTANKNNIKTFISWDSIIYSHLELTGKGVTYKKQSLFLFLISFFQENSMTNLVHSFRYFRRHCALYLLIPSFCIDKLRLIYSFLKRRDIE